MGISAVHCRQASGGIFCGWLCFCGRRLFWPLCRRRRRLLGATIRLRPCCLLGVQNIPLGLVGGMLGVPIWLFWMATWSMVLFGIGRCLFLLFGIGGIIAIVGRLRSSSISKRTTGLRFMVPMNTWIFERRLSFRFVSTVGFWLGGFFCCGIVSIPLMD